MNQFSSSRLPFVGRPSGILGPLRKSRFDGYEVTMGRFHVRMVFFDSKLQVKWAVVIVYGAA